MVLLWNFVLNWSLFENGLDNTCFISNRRVETSYFCNNVHWGDLNEQNLIIILSQFFCFITNSFTDL